MNGETGSDKALSDRLFLQIVCGVSLAICVAFIAAATFFDANFPTTFIALFFGVFVGVLIYVFVDPSEENKIAIGGLSLGGMTAVVVLFAYLFADDINTEMNPPPSDEEAQQQIVDLEADLRKANREVATLKSELADAASANGNTTALTDASLLAAIRQTTPDSDLGKSILDIFNSGDGPFDPTIGDVEVRVAFNEKIAGARFHYCHTARDDLAGPVRFSRVVDGEVLGPVQLEPANDIGTRNCSNPQIDYEAKLGCDAATELLTAEEYTGCKNGEPIRWLTDKKRFELSATRLNPAMLPREDR